VITRADIVERVREWELAEQVVEKDYVLGWLLWGIGSDSALSQHWVFKGGTRLKKCYIETYRFSEGVSLKFSRRLGRGEPDRSSASRDAPRWEGHRRRAADTVWVHPPSLPPRWEARQHASGPGAGVADQ